MALTDNVLFQNHLKQTIELITQHPMEVTLQEHKEVTLCTELKKQWMICGTEFFEAQSTNDFFRTENLALKRQLLKMARENQENRQQQLTLITELQDEIQELKTRVTEAPKGKESFFPEKKNHTPNLSHNLQRTFPNLTRIEVRLNFVCGKITGKKLKLLSESQIAMT